MLYLNCKLPEQMDPSIKSKFAQRHYPIIKNVYNYNTGAMIKHDNNLEIIIKQENERLTSIQVIYKIEILLYLCCL